MNTNLYKAIAAVSSEAPVMGKNADNPFFKSKYVPLEKVLTVLKPLLVKHELCVMQPLEDRGITTTVSHIPSGETLSFFSSIAVTGDQKPQDQMSGVSYMKRYALIGLFLLETGDHDDDGNAVSHAAEAEAATEVISKADGEAMLKLLDQLPDTVGTNLLKWAGATTLEDFPKSKLEQAVQGLLKKTADLKKLEMAEKLMDEKRELLRSTEKVVESPDE